MVCRQRRAGIYLYPEKPLSGAIGIGGAVASAMLIVAALATLITLSR